MSLTNAPSTSNVSENWIAQLFHQNSYLSFDGTDDYIDLGETTSSSAIAIGSSTGITIAFWINFPTLGAAEPIFRSHDHATNYVGYAVDKDSSNQISFSWYDGSGSGSGDRRTMTGDTALSADTWYFVIITSTFANATSGTKIYINGTTSDSITASGTYSGTYPVYSGSSLKGIIGQKLPSTDIWGEFKLRNLGIWASVLDSANLTVIYNSGNFLSFLQDTGNYDQSSALKGYWEFNNGDNIIQDKSGNGAHGTITGGIYENFLPISLSDTTVDNVFYHGTITNNPSIRSSIDLDKSIADTDNISLSIANFQTDGTDFYKLIFNGTNNYHNKGVRIYAQFHGESALSNCQRIFTGRLVDITVDQNQNIKMQINSHRPWDKIEFPQTKHSKYNIYQPVVYGSYNYSDATSGATNDAAYGGVFPVPILYTNRNTIVTVLPKTYTAGSHCYIHHYVGYDWFCSIKTEGSGMTDATTTEGGVDILETPSSDRATGWIRTNNAGYNASDTGGSVTYLSNAQNALDFNLVTGAADTTTYATGDINSTSDIRYITIQTPNKQFAVTIIDAVKVKHSILWDDGSGDPQQYLIDFFSNEYDSSADDLLSSPLAKNLSNSISTHELSFNTTPANAVASETALVCPDELLMKYDPQNTPTLYDHEDHELRVYDIQMRYENRFNYNDNDRKRVADLKYFYCGAAGLTATWDSDAISHGHDAHRDMLIRFAGVSTEDPEVNTGEAWSVLNTDRAIDNWKIRYWQLEPTSLKDALDKMAYESGFVSKFSPSNKLKYIYVKQSSELSALLNLTKDDIANVNVSTTGIDNVHATMDISNRVNAAEPSRYYAVTRATDASLITKYNLGDKEGITAVNLDMNVGTIPTTANADCNADWYSYMHNIIGDMKILVNCQVVNPAKGYQLETGDIVTFTDMPVEMFGTDFATDKYFMIIETKRSPGKVGITAREVG